MIIGVIQSGFNSTVAATAVRGAVDSFCYSIPIFENNSDGCIYSLSCGRSLVGDTLNGAYTYKVFAAFNMRYDDFAPEKADFETADDFARFMDFVKSSNLHESDVTVTGDDHLLTLITCDRTYGGADGRFVVMAVRED